MDDITPRVTPIVASIFPIVLVWAIYAGIMHRYKFTPKDDFFSSGACMNDVSRMARFTNDGEGVFAPMEKPLRADGGSSDDDSSDDDYDDSDDGGGGGYVVVHGERVKAGWQRRDRMWDGTKFSTAKQDLWQKEEAARKEQLRKSKKSSGADDEFRAALVDKRTGGGGQSQLQDETTAANALSKTLASADDPAFRAPERFSKSKTTPSSSARYADRSSDLRRVLDEEALSTAQHGCGGGGGFGGYNNDDGAQLYGGGGLSRFADDRFAAPVLAGAPGFAANNSQEHVLKEYERQQRWAAGLASASKSKSNRGAAGFDDGSISRGQTNPLPPITSDWSKVKAERVRQFKHRDRDTHNAPAGGAGGRQPPSYHDL